MYPTNTVQSIILLFMSLLVSAVTTFGAFDWLKDAFDYEHCGSDWIKPDINGLYRDMDRKLYGQHLVRDVVGTLVEAHIDNHQPSKALVLSFHGSTGVGKNYVSTMIANRLYKRGMQSKFVKPYIATVDFHSNKDVNGYKATLQAEISATVGECGRSMFIFDEVDKMPDGVLDAIKPYLDHHHDVQGVDYRRAIFIFLSNSGGNAIAEFTLNHWNNGLKRNDITLKNVETLLMKTVFNAKGGLKYSSVIDKNLVSAFVPFLPLERKHVKGCIHDNATAKHINLKDDEVNAIADELEYFPADKLLFSSSGCKRVDEKVNLYWRSRRSDTGRRSTGSRSHSEL